LISGYRDEHLKELPRRIVGKWIFNDGCADVFDDPIHLHDLGRHTFEISPSSANARARRLLSSTMVSKATGTRVLTNWPGLTLVLRTMPLVEASTEQ
jgi:hypothetical protein